MEPLTSFYFHIVRHLLSISEVAIHELQSKGYTEDEILSQVNLFGSKFFNFDNPKELVTFLYSLEKIGEIKQPNDRIALILQANHNIGLTSLSKIENNSIFETEKRGEFDVKIKWVETLQETNQACLILENDKPITAFPGNYAPPFPSSVDVSEWNLFCIDFWENHCLLKVKST